MSISGVYGFSELTNIEGTLVPLASINRVPSKIPFVGGLFKGDNEGEGLIGIKYKIYELVITDEKYTLKLSDFNKDGDLIVSLGKKKKIIVRIEN